jgi:hypothetical protein
MNYNKTNKYIKKSRTKSKEKELERLISESKGSGMAF